MASRELVVNIPDNYDLSKIQNGSIASKTILNAVANGIPFPFMNKPCISSEVCEHDKDKALDKIRGEIEKLQTYKMFIGEKTVYVERDDVLEIIDKYRGESGE